MPLPIDENPFQYMVPSDKSMPILNELRARFLDLWTYMKEALPDSREKAVAITNLETTAMWANKSAVGRGS